MSSTIKWESLGQDVRVTMAQGIRNIKRRMENATAEAQDIRAKAEREAKECDEKARCLEIELQQWGELFESMGTTVDRVADGDDARDVGRPPVVIGNNGVRVGVVDQPGKRERRGV